MLIFTFGEFYVSIKRYLIFPFTARFLAPYITMLKRIIIHYVIPVKVGIQDSPGIMSPIEYYLGGTAK
jgi:hypothetical protein